MIDVMGRCDQGQKFQNIVDCIKETYQKEGNEPNAGNIKAFYANLDEISDANLSGQLTDAQAKSAAFRAFLSIVQSENDRRNGIVRQQQQQQIQQQQQQIQQQQQTQSAIDAFIRNTQVQQPPQPVYTQCQRNGQLVNCTSR